MDRQKGVSLFLTIVILSVILAIVLGLSTILVGQIKTIREMGNSVIALYAADTGVERVLKITLDYVRGEPISLESSYSEADIGNGASYLVNIVCCKYNKTKNPDCYFTGGQVCPMGSGYEDSACESNYFCLRSVGVYSDTKRAIEVEVFPVD